MRQNVKALCVSLVQAAGIVAVVQFAVQDDRVVNANDPAECNVAKLDSPACKQDDIEENCPVCGSVSAWGREYTNNSVSGVTLGTDQFVEFEDVDCFTEKECRANFQENKECIGTASCQTNTNETCPAWTLIVHSPTTVPSLVTCPCE